MLTEALAALAASGGTARDALLAALLEAPPGSAHVLCAAGGHGKTTVALAVADQARRQGSDVWRVSGADAESLSAGMRALTSRNQSRSAWGDLVQLHPLRELSTEHAAQMLRDRAGVDAGTLEHAAARLHAPDAAPGWAVRGASPARRPVARRTPQPAHVRGVPERAR